MKKLIQYIKTAGILTLFIPIFAACNKEELEAEKAIQVIINGYNGSANELEVSIDTTRYDKSVANGNFILKPAAMIGFNAVYTYRSPALRSKVTLTDPATGEVFFSKPLPATGTKANFNYIYLDGKVVEVNPPAATDTINKLGFYIHYADSDAPFDIFLYRIDNTTGQEYRAYLAKHVKRGTWIYIDYIPSADFDSKQALSNAKICFTKAGTTDQWAFQDNETMSKLEPSGMGFPVAGEKGLVLPYFITPGSWQLEHSRLFFYPDRF
ncbi:hypothetical protein [Chitinophaga defluvii]|uniref:Uncharacterized protein n=1 Tax=Chitinophaga defluvii TaxID=3163343 RepID=A0ABV2TA13_9BACT